MMWLLGVFESEEEEMGKPFSFSPFTFFDISLYNRRSRYSNAASIGSQLLLWGQTVQIGHNPFHRVLSHFP